MPMCPEKEPFRILDSSARPLQPWVQTMLNHIGDMEELKRQLKTLNERLADMREKEKLSAEEEHPPIRVNEKPPGGPWAV
jgi:hypothetical protein